MNRSELLQEMAAGRTRLDALLARLTPEQIAAPTLPGGWSMKDLLGHLGWWERRALEIYHESLETGSPNRPIGAEQLDAVNAEVYAQFHAADLATVRQYEQQAYADLLTMAQTAPDDDLFDPQRFAWLSGAPFYEWVLGNSAEHIEEHWGDLEGLAM